MKKKITLLLLFLMTAAMLRSQTLEESLKTAFIKLDAAKTEQELIAASAQFDVVAAKWNTQWITNYYAAYCKIKISFKLKDKTKRDQYLDAAKKYMEKADQLSPNNQELFILEAWCAKARIAVDGFSRWKEYGKVYDSYIEKAKKINPENPRICFLEGQTPFYKPKIWGGGKDKAKPYFEKAKLLFVKENKSNILIPSWGQKENEELLKQCND